MAQLSMNFYLPSIVSLKGFGQLHPRSLGVETLGTIYSSSLFPNRAPDGRILLLNYIGGATNPGILAKKESELVEAVDRDLRKMLIKPNAKDPLTLGVRVWPQAIPQFLIGHFDILDTAKNALREKGLEGLFLGGNYVYGVALGKCVEGAYETADTVSNFLSRYAYKAADSRFKYSEVIQLSVYKSVFRLLYLL